MNIGTAKKVMTMIRRIFDSAVPTEPMTDQRPGKPEFSPRPIGLERGDISGSGINPRALGDLLLNIRSDSTLNVHGLLVLKDGKLVCDARFGMHGNDIHKQTFSQCKSVTSIAVGMLVDEGKLSLGEKLVSIFPDETGPLAKLALRDLKIVDLLTMTSTVTFNEAEAMCENGWISCFMNSSLKGEIGKTFNYNSLNTYMLAAAVVRKSGVSLTEYLKPRLFDKLGITDPFWEKSPEGIEKGGWGLYIRPEDMAKIGLMLMNGGVYNGERILSEEYTEAATKTQIQPPAAVSSNGYGYQIWTGDDFFLFNGMFGQNLMCYRGTGVTVVSNGGTGELFQSSSFYTKMTEAFAKKDSYMFEKESAGDAEYLENALKAIAFRAPEPVFPAETVGRGLIGRLFAGRRKRTPVDPLLKFDGVTLVTSDRRAASAGLLPMILQATQNTYAKGIKEVGFKEKNGTLTVIFDESGETRELAVGYYEPADSHLDFSGEKYLVKASGKTAKNEDGDDVLTIDADFTETPCSRRIKFVFSGDGATVFMTEKPSERFIEDSVFNVKQTFSESALLRPILGRIDDDFLDFKTERVFAPKFSMTLKK
ncbi:MAG: serine hydrolase [Clostridia bacterium]|nr:serine hydrolase [Clostridia bacterium]